MLDTLSVIAKLGTGVLRNIFFIPKTFFCQDVLSFPAHKCLGLLKYDSPLN